MTDGTAAQQGWIKLFHRFRHWEWYGDPNMVALFVHLLLRANFKPVSSRGVTHGRGVVATSREELSRQTGISPQSIRTCLARLKSTGEVTVTSTRGGTVITITNYDRYQSPAPDVNPESNQDINREPTDNQPTINQRSTSCKEIKNIRNKYFVVADRAREEFLDDFFREENRATLEALCKNLDTDTATLRRLAEAAVDEWQATGEPPHQDVTAARRHLLNHIRIKLNAGRRVQSGSGRPRAAEKPPRYVNDSWKDFIMPPL